MPSRPAPGLLELVEDRLLVGHLGVDLAAGDVAGVGREQLRERRLALGQGGQRVQRREHAGVGAPEVAEVEVPGVLAAEDGAGLGHLAP